MQNKIDRLITNGNLEFSEQRNVVAALVDYSRCLDLYEMLDRSYKIQFHELLVRIAICYDILGNFNKTIEFLNKALNVVPNVASLILYKSVLLQTLGKTDDAQKILIKYKQISGKKKKELYETFRLVFYYSMQLEKEVLLREINEYFEKYNKNAVILYLRGMIFLEMSNHQGNSSNSGISSNTSSKLHQQPDYYLKYEADIKEALELEPQDTEFLIKDGITNENLTKLFFMILPDMDYYQPKPLVNYKTFHSGIKILYIILKAVKMFKIKVEKKKLKKFYSNKLKLYKKKMDNSKSPCDNSDNSNTYSNNSFLCQNQSEQRESDKITGNEGSSISANTQNKTVITGNISSDMGEKDAKESSENKESTNTFSSDMSKQNKFSKLKLKPQSNHNIGTERTHISGGKFNKTPTIVNIKNNVEKASNDDIINEIKKEYEVKVKSLYKTVWLYNLRLNDHINYNFETDIDSNYFIKNKYYAPFNLKENLIAGVKQNIEYNKTNRCSSVDRDLKNSPNTIRTLNSASIKNKLFNSNKTTKTSPNPPLLNNLKITNNFCTAKKEEILADFSVSEINHKPLNHGPEQDTMSFSSEINLLDNNNYKSNKEELLRSNNAVNNLKKFEKDKLKLQKITTEVIKNEVLNTKKFIHRPSPRMDFFKLNILNSKFTSFSKEKLYGSHNINSAEKIQIPSNNSNNNISSNSNLNSNNLANKSDNTGNNIQAGNSFNSNNEPAKTQASGQITLRKSLEFNKIKINDEILKKGVNNKQMLFKNIQTKNINGKFSTALVNNKIKRNDNSNSNLKTNENI